MHREESGVHNTCSDNLHVINCFYCLRCIQTCFTVYYCLVIVKTVDLFLVQTLHNLFFFVNRVEITKTSQDKEMTLIIFYNKAQTGVYCP